MMRIKKVFIKNFKGIRDKKIIDFSDQTSILVGPNGFGKTTIFDILELCLTGRINRTFEKANVTKDTSDYKKPFYQNTIGEDVVVKVWLENENEDKIENLIIVKYLYKNNDGKSNVKGRRYKPCDFDLLSTYKELPKDFRKDEFTPIEENRIDNGDIDKFFNFDVSKFKVEKIYKLFNYLQQEDTTYFLKKSEKDRKSSLGFLFQTDKEETKLEELNKMYSNLNRIKEKLKDKINTIENYELLGEIEYKKIFYDKDFEFDKKDVFDKIDLDMSSRVKEKIFEELDQLSDFVKRFSPDENLIKIKVKQIQDKIEDNGFMNGYVLQKFIDKSSYELLVRERSLLNDKSKLKAYILQKCILKFKDYELVNKNWSDYENFLKLDDHSLQLEEIKKYVKDIMPEKSEEYINILKNRDTLIETTNEIEITISEIIRFRNSIKNEVEKNRDNNKIDDTECPYCGKPWETYEDIMIAFREREESFKKLDTNQLRRLEECNNIIKDVFFEPIIKYMKEYIENNKRIEGKVLEIIQVYKDIKFDFEDIKKIDINEDLVWSKPYTYAELEKKIKNLEDIIEKKLHVSEEVFNKIKSLYNISFKKDIEVIEKICSRGELSQYIISNKDRKITMNDIEVNTNLLKKFLEETKEEYKYDYHKTNDDENLYEKYFDLQKDKFILLNEKCIKSKKEYIEYKFSKKQNSLTIIYKERFDKIDKIIKRIEKLKEVYNQTIVEYKKDMANKIKIPFYIYTAKILQNYQQGMGVFLSTKENSDSIRFLTDSSSDHDAMHHLSSGQLSVVALAFCLAVNKTYNISSNLKMLIIDDPIQEMDALNIHSFIELMRHEFIKDYQLIFSTHNDSNALYLKYKFEKMEEKSVKMINVQNEFFNY